MKKGPLIIAHRGASTIAPENTMIAFRRALAAGADGLEFDVRVAADDIPVVIHDPDLRRTAGVNRRVRDVASAELQTIDVGGWFARANNLRHEQFSSETIPALDDVLKLCENLHLVLYLEMKCNKEEREPLVDACVAALSRVSLAGSVVVESFDLEAISLLKTKAPRIRTAALFEPSLFKPHVYLCDNLITKAKSVRADEIALHRKLASRSVTTRAKAENLGVVVWTVDSPHWIERARSLGVDAVITNRPAALLKERDG